MVFKKKDKKEEKKSSSKKQWVVQIREVLDNKQFADSVTMRVGSKKAKEIYKILEEE